MVKLILALLLASLASSASQQQGGISAADTTTTDPLSNTTSTAAGQVPDLTTAAGQVPDLTTDQGSDKTTGAGQVPGLTTGAGQVPGLTTGAGQVPGLTTEDPLKDVQENVASLEHQTEITDCEKSCPFSKVQNAPMDTLCQEVDDYSVCAHQNCNLTAAQKGSLTDMVNQCKKDQGSGPTTGNQVPDKTTEDPLKDVQENVASMETQKEIRDCENNCSFSKVQNAPTDTLCQEVDDFSACAHQNCNLTDAQKRSLTDMVNQCKTVTTQGGGNGGDDDDGCSILQVSTLALMLSLLLSII